ncbi:porin/voltage-dependent anion-selective channel protein [Moesziomyces antarcticus T-34]|uniref:Clathrin light chain n=1 Tax=Pseudozyma antarctica (strain T-34) TaxID=1151754 RepID=M9LWF2_PSEA3|nr:porin/voltage-dependent anion-selective channel protein [Moesziomyces antarcticus T-34]
MAFDFGESKPSDPTADFLAREREAAGVLSGDADLFGSSGAAGGAGSADDFERSASAFPALDDDGLPAPTSSNAAPSGGFGFDDIDDRPEPTSTTSAKPVDDEVGKFEQNFPELDDGAATNTNGASYHDDTDDLMSAPAPAASRSAAPAQPSYSYSYEEPTEEAELVRLWRESQKDAIAKRDAEGERKKAEAISQAEQDIDKFYAEYNAKKEKNIAANKEAEAKLNEQRTRELAEGTTWNRVTKLLELQNSQSKTIARSGPGSSDLTRMKELYLSLRREGETAPGAAGY